jgi:hypothetical protein
MLAMNNIHRLRNARTKGKGRQKVKVKRQKIGGKPNFDKSGLP